MIEVVAGLIRHRGKILLARRQAGCHLAGYWEFPGGKLEPGETPEQALRRELREELAIATEVLGYLGESRYDYGHKQVRLLGYHCRYLSGEFSLDSHDAIVWVTPAKLPDYRLAPADIPLVEQLLRAG